MQAVIQPRQVPNAEVVLADIASPFWVSGLLLPGDTIILLLSASLEVLVNVGFPSLHSPLIHPFTFYIISPLHLSFKFFQTSPPVEGTLASATVLVPIAGSSTSLAGASPQSTPSSVR